MRPPQGVRVVLRSVLRVVLVTGCAVPAGPLVAVAMPVGLAAVTVLTVTVRVSALVVNAEVVVSVTGGGALAGGLGVLTAAPLADPLLEDPPLSLTSAAVSPARESTASTTRLTTSRRQRGTGARRVRAAVPHRRHQS